jgi:ketosteroid isomerase-like protein
MSDTKKWDDDLNAMILSGKGFPDGFEKYYADDVVMIEADGTSSSGKEANRKREIEFVSAVQEWHGSKLLASAAQGDVSFSEWEFEVTFKDGKRRLLKQVARRRWKDGKIVEERFYYDPQALG